jgi:hypothetical protein
MNSESLINWIEGYLDACKNKPNYNQVREIRKKIDEYRKPASPILSGGTYTYVPGFTGPALLTDSPTYTVHTGTPTHTVHTGTAHTSTPTLTLAGSTVSDSSKMVNDEITELIEKAKRATTMEELDAE